MQEKSNKLLSKSIKNKKVSKEEINSKNKKENEKVEINDKKIKIVKKLEYIFNKVKTNIRYQDKRKEHPENLKCHTESDNSEYSKKNELINKNNEKVFSSNNKIIINKLEHKSKDKEKNKSRVIIEKLKIKSGKKDESKIPSKIKEETKEINDSELKNKTMRNKKLIERNFIEKEKVFKKDDKEIKKEGKIKSLVIKNIIQNKSKNFDKLKNIEKINFRRKKNKTQFININNNSLKINENPLYTSPKENINNNKTTRVYCPRKPINLLKIKTRNKKIDFDYSINNNKHCITSSFNSIESFYDNNIYTPRIISYINRKSNDKPKNSMYLNKSFSKPNYYYYLENINKKSKEIYYRNKSGLSRSKTNTYFITDSNLLNHKNSIICNLYKNNNFFYSGNKNNNYNNLSRNSVLMTNISFDDTNMNNLYNLNKTSYLTREYDYNSINNSSNDNYLFYYNNKINNVNNNPNKINLSINLQDLLILEEKFTDIISNLKINKSIYNECSEFLDFYFNSSLCGNIEKLFSNILDYNNIQINIKYILTSLIIFYDCSFDITILNKVLVKLKEILYLNHKNMVLIYEYILGKINIEEKNNRSVIKLVNIVNSFKSNEINSNFSSEIDNVNNIKEYYMGFIEKINFNKGTMIQNIKDLLNNLKTPKADNLTNFFIKLNEKSYNEIYTFFKQNIYNIINMNGSLYSLASIKTNFSINFTPEPYPYINIPNPQNYSLVLDLNETLVHLNINQKNASECSLILRPGIKEFLEEMNKYYELIIFTGSTQEYANLLIDAIEEDKIYFIQRLYRNHLIIVDNEFTKDLSRIGRPLDKIIIVDNKPQNFRLQKENGICIKSFWGEDTHDIALINLKNILVKIAKDGGDIRIGIKKYKNEIIEKVQSNLYKYYS